MMDAAYPIGFIGLGTMGEAMARIHSTAPICKVLNVEAEVRAKGPI